MFDVFKDVSQGKYERKSIVAATKQHPACPLQFDSSGQILALGKYLNYNINNSIYHFSTRTEL